jgi:hypothetical protein
MTPASALEVFVRAVFAEKRDRAVDFIRRPRARLKFLALLCHQLGSLFRADSLKTALPADAWSLPAFRFRVRAFGESVSSLRAAFEEGAQEELVITVDGRFGYWRDEDLVDSETLVAADPERHRRAREVLRPDVGPGESRT